MSNQNKNLNELIRVNFERARRLMDDKAIAKSMIDDLLNQITITLENKILFTRSERTDNDGDLVTTIFIGNPKNKKKEAIISYYFNAETIFPAVMMYQNIIHQRCESIDDVSVFIEKLVSHESFMIKVIRVSEEIENPIDFDDDIPF